MIERLGYYGLLFYCFSMAVSRAAVHISIALLTVLFLVSVIRRYVGKHNNSLAGVNLPKAVHPRGLLCFVFGMCVSLIASDNIAVSVKTIATFVYYFLPLFFIDAFIRSKDQLNRLCQCLVASVFIGGAIALFQGMQGVQRAKGFVGIMDLGGVLGILVPFMAALAVQALRVDEKKRGYLFACAVLIGIGALLANGTRINWIGAAVTLGGLFLINLRQLSWKKISSIVLLGLVIVAGASVNSGIMERFAHIFNPSTDPAIYKRIDMWHYGLSVFMQHPILGVGIGVLPELAFNELQRITHVMGYGHYGHVHSVYLQLLAETGVVGLISYFGFLAVTILRPWWSSRQQSVDRFAGWSIALLLILVSFLINGATDYILGIGQIVYSFAVTTAICLKGMKLYEK